MLLSSPQRANDFACLLTAACAQVGGKQILFDWPETEGCNCPTGDGENFAENFGCRATEVQLEKDMEKCGPPWPKPPCFGRIILLRHPLIINPHRQPPLFPQQC